MASMIDKPKAPGIILTPEQKKRQRARNIAIGLVVGGLVVLFYAMTIVRLGPSAFTHGS